jgi:hypothetical protein
MSVTIDGFEGASTSSECDQVDPDMRAMPRAHAGRFDLQSRARRITRRMDTRSPASERDLVELRAAVRIRSDTERNGAGAVPRERAARRRERECTACVRKVESSTARSGRSPA